MPHYRHITLTTLLHSPAVKIDRKDRPRYAQAPTYTHIRRKMHTPSGVDMWHLWGQPHLHREEK